MFNKKRILVTGGAGFLGKHLVRELKSRYPESEIFAPRSVEYDLREKEHVNKLFDNFNADVVIHLATTAGGIGYNKEHPGSLYYEQIMMNTLLMDVARKRGVEKFVAIGTALAYPNTAEIPLKEEKIWIGYPEESLAPIGFASKMMLVQGNAYRKEFGFNAIYVILANLYGPEDHFERERSHVIPATIMKFEDAKINGKSRIEMWGGGKASREFLYVKDASEGIVVALEKYNQPEPLNIGSGKEITIRELVEKISGLIGYSGEIFWDTTKPEGQLRRCMDITKMSEKTGFKAETDFDEGLKETIKWYLENKNV
ncbi:MAG: NAD-dependent epimerase/dehydratase family protein [Candidatus Pacearchaeota archaeon]|nr:NAD-dependent epimerase/dehydratase family protein [Candidatus Pacearchaeota archaeon]